MKTESNNTYIWEFDFAISVECPVCSKEAIVTKMSKETFADRRCVCNKCSFTKTWVGNSLSYNWNDGEMSDPVFNYRLFFQIAYKNHNLWAYNRKHITLLENWIGADLREKCELDHKYHRSLESTLPKWMTAKKNRSDILKALNKLKTKA